jgi:hypothetical protein
MTQRQKFAINAFQRDAYEAYLAMCIHLNEVPRLDIVTLISGCQDVARLKETILIFKAKID